MRLCLTSDEIAADHVGPGVADNSFYAEGIFSGTIQADGLST